MSSNLYEDDKLSDDEFREDTPDVDSDSGSSAHADDGARSDAGDTSDGADSPVAEAASDALVDDESGDGSEPPPPPAK